MAGAAYQIAFDGEPVDEEFYGDVDSLTAAENSDTASTLTLRLVTVLQDDGSWSYLDDARLGVFTRVTVSAGFLGGGGIAGALGGLTGGGNGLEPVFDGYITAVSVNLSSGPGGSRIDVSAMDTSVLMSLEDKIATWPNLSDSDIVQQIVAGYGVQAQIEPTPTVHQENDTTVVQRGTDIQFVRGLARRNGREFYFETDKDSGEVVASFRAPQLDGTPQPDLAIRFGEESNLRRFSARLNGQRPLSVKTEQIDIRANGAASAQAGDIALARLGASDLNALAGGALGSLVSPQDTLGQMLVLGPPTSDATELQTIAQAVRDESGWFIEATGEINSDAYQAVLRPRRTVLVKGAGSQYSGAYYVTGVVHTFSSDGSYTQTFEARRNARDLDGSEQFGGNGLALPLPGL